MLEFDRESYVVSYTAATHDDRIALAGGSSGPREFEPEFASVTQRGFETESAAHAFGRLGDDGETDAGAFIFFL